MIPVQGGREGGAGTGEGEEGNTVLVSGVTFFFHASCVLIFFLGQRGHLSFRISGLVCLPL